MFFHELLFFGEDLLLVLDVETVASKVSIGVVLVGHNRYFVVPNN